MHMTPLWEPLGGNQTESRTSPTSRIERVKRDRAVFKPVLSAEPRGGAVVRSSLWDCITLVHTVRLPLLGLSEPYYRRLGR